MTRRILRAPGLDEADLIGIRRNLEIAREIVTKATFRPYHDPQAHFLEAGWGGFLNPRKPLLTVEVEKHLLNVTIEEHRKTSGAIFRERAMFDRSNIPTSRTIKRKLLDMLDRFDRCLSNRRPLRHENLDRLEALFEPFADSLRALVQTQFPDLDFARWEIQILADRKYVGNDIHNNDWLSPSRIWLVEPKNSIGRSYALEPADAGLNLRCPPSYLLIHEAGYPDYELAPDSITIDVGPAMTVVDTMRSLKKIAHIPGLKFVHVKSDYERII